MGAGDLNAGRNPAMDKHPVQGGVEIPLVASCYGNQDKPQPDGPLGSYPDLWKFGRKRNAVETKPQTSVTVLFFGVFPTFLTRQFIKLWK